jgi:hypothetical protein
MDPDMDHARLWPATGTSCGRSLCGIQNIKTSDVYGPTCAISRRRQPMNRKSTKNATQLRQSSTIWMTIWSRVICFPA